MSPLPILEHHPAVGTYRHALCKINTRRKLPALYIVALTKIVPWFFALDHIYYSRLIPVYLRDMVLLQECHHNVYEEFMKGKKKKHAFSAIAIDQAHEQNNASVKGENPAALRRWIVSGPKMACVIGEFEFSTKKRQDKDWRHHEQKKHVQMAFA